MTLVSKVIQKAIYSLLQDYLQENGLIYKYQAGFRGIWSTDLCVVQLTHFVLTGMVKGIHTGMIFIDLQETSDAWT